VWQGADQQEWVGEIHRALTGERRTHEGRDVGAFSLADPTVATGLLNAVGFSSVKIVGLREPVYYGANASEAHLALASLGMVENIVGDLDATARAHSLDRLVALLDAHDTGKGVWFDSRVWLISARKQLRRV
jgi:hypothetical protein